MQTEPNMSISHDRPWDKRLLTAAVTIALFLLMLFNAKEATVYAQKSLYLCATSVIPSLFPLMIASSMLVAGGGCDIITRIFGYGINRIFGISKCSAAAVIPGFLCGFPIGATAAMKLYENRRISKDELSRLLTFVNNPGAAFVIYTVGVGMLGSAKLGVIIYISVLLSAVTAGILGRFVFPVKPLDVTNTEINTIPISKLVVSSVSSAVMGALNVCAYSAFFSAAVGVIYGILSRHGAPYGFCAALFGFCELIGGVGILTQSSSRLFATLSAAAVCSWSGLSVIMQIAAACYSPRDEDTVSLVPMILSKCFQAILSPLLVLLFIKLTRFDI